jgi:hypothetical protein
MIHQRVGTSLSGRARNCLKNHLWTNDDRTKSLSETWAAYDEGVDMCTRGKLRHRLRYRAGRQSIESMLLGWKNCGPKTAAEILAWIA